MKRVIGAAVLAGALAGCASGGTKIETAQFRPTTTTTKPAPATTTTVQLPPDTHGISLTGEAHCAGGNWTVTWTIHGAPAGAYVAQAVGETGGVEQGLQNVIDNWGDDFQATFQYPGGLDSTHEMVLVNWYETEGGQIGKWPHQGAASARVVRPPCTIG